MNKGSYSNKYGNLLLPYPTLSWFLAILLKFQFHWHPMSRCICYIM